MMHDVACTIFVLAVATALLLWYGAILTSVGFAQAVGATKRFVKSTQG